MQKNHETQIISSPSTHPYYNAQLDVFVWIFNKNRRKALIMYQGIDAAGNIPAPLTESELKWRSMLDSGQLKYNMEKLRKRQAMPLDEKIHLSMSRIKEWYQAFNGNVAVSYSGGKDSEVLLWLVRIIYPDVPAVFCNTGLEYPEIVKHVKTHENVVIMRPRMPFHKVISTYGYPLISKKIARGISVLRNPNANNQNIFRLYNEGVNRFGQHVNGFKVSARWKFLVDAPFESSDKCCSIMKKEPMHRYGQETGNAQFVGTMATDSKVREKTYLQNGCNAFDMKIPKSTPLGFWTEQDILECIVENNIPYASVYGDIEKTAQWKLRTTGVRRTGCAFCAFGVHLDNNPNRFQLMHDTHPRLWDYCMDRLNMRTVFQYIREYCPDRNVIGNFNPVPISKPKQMELFA